MADSLTFKYTLAEEDFVLALRAHAFGRMPRWLRWIALAALLFVLVSAVHYVISWPSARNFGMFWLIFVAVFPVVWFCWVWWWHPKRVAREAPYLNAGVEGTASVDGIASRSRLGNHEAGWGSYSAAFESADHFLLYLGRNVFNPLPKRAFTNPQDVIRFRELIRAHVPKARLLNRQENG